MALMDEAVWRGRIYSGGWVDGGGGTSNLEAFTNTRWVTIRGDIVPYPF
jgi:benzaldehyde dehydrogenase (NAD)